MFQCYMIFWSIFGCNLSKTKITINSTKWFAIWSTFFFGLVWFSFFLAKFGQMIWTILLQHFCHQNFGIAWKEMTIYLLIFFFPASWIKNWFNPEADLTLHWLQLINWFNTLIWSFVQSIVSLHIFITLYSKKKSFNLLLYYHYYWSWLSFVHLITSFCLCLISRIHKAFAGKKNSWKEENFLGKKVAILNENFFFLPFLIFFISTLYFYFSVRLNSKDSTHLEVIFSSYFDCKV